jgi:hypothetical protein
MTKAIQKITLSPSRNIPFNKLVLSQSTVWFVNAGVLIEQLAKSTARRTWKLCMFAPTDAARVGVSAKVLCIACFGEREVA